MGDPSAVAGANPPSSSLFPVSAAAPPPLPAPSHPPQWLSNSSFTFDPSSLPNPPSAAPATAPDPASSDSDSPPIATPAPPPPSYSLVPSSNDSSEEDRRARRKERRRKKRKRDSEPAARGSDRKSGVRAWQGSDTKPAKDYYFDSHGDRDNLAFGSLYRMDIAHYRLQNSSTMSGHAIQALYHWRLSFSSMDVEEDLDIIDSKLRAGGRYYSVKYTALERQKGFKHVRIVGKKSAVLIPGEFIPLVELQSTSGSGSHVSTSEDIEESWEDELIRRTRELNRLSRDLPHDEKVWLAFAEFQDKVSSAQTRKAARYQILEKKIGIMEKAVELNPDNEELLLCLLKSYQSRDSSDVLMERWENVLMQHSESCRLWKEFLLVRQGEFSRFKISDMRKTYAHAVLALSAACTKLCRQGSQVTGFKLTDPSLVHLELGLVDIFVSLCRFEWQAGYQELATGLFQAQMEYSLFCPSLLLSPQSKQRLFEHFWNSGVARIGEDGALGWSTWLEREEQNTQTAFTEEMPQETEVGGWTGWSDRSLKRSGISEDPEELTEQSTGHEKNEENLDDEETQIPPDDVESLLRKLGINVDAEPHTEVQDAKTWNRWSEEEILRDCEQWMPVREHSGMENNEQLSRVILFEDVSEYIFSLYSEEARLSLISQFIDFYGGKISQWTCTNNSSWIEKILSLETVPNSIFEDLKNIFELVNRPRSCSSDIKFESVFGSTTDLSGKSNMMKFLRNTILLCLGVFPRNYSLKEAVLSAEELFMTRMQSPTYSTNPSRALAKSLLKKDRQDLLLCGVYARSEATWGNIDVARKIFDMALSSTDGLPIDLKDNIPLIYFWYAEMELATSSLDNPSELSKQRAVHILCCLGGSMPYMPFISQTSGLQILRARQGFKDQIKGLRSVWARGDIKEHSIAYICSASLFEFLTNGWSAGIELIEETLSMALPERRSRSLQLESLWIYYIEVLQKHLKQIKFSRAWEIITSGKQIYPYNPKTFTTIVKVGYHFTVPNKLRRIFDESSKRNPSAIVYLFALSFELGSAGSKHRIHGLFEKALANDKLQKSVLLWRCYLAYETDIARNASAARRVFFRAIHACPWSKRLWVDGFEKLSSILTMKELSDLQEVMREKELHLRTDIYEILLQDEMEA